jgi:hypothetical protein
MFTKEIGEIRNKLSSACHEADVGCFYLFVSQDQTEAVFVCPPCPNLSDPAIEHSILELVGEMRNPVSQINDMSSSLDAELVGR